MAHVDDTSTGLGHQWLQQLPEELSDGFSTSRLEEELSASVERCGLLESENVTLRESLRRTINESALGREFEALARDRERMMRAVDQLKIEKSHLVESVLSLSNEVDDANRLRQDDQLRFKQEVLRHGENDKAMRASKYRMGMQVVELLKIRGVDQALCQEVNAYMANACAVSTPVPGTSLGGMKWPPGDRAFFTFGGNSTPKGGSMPSASYDENERGQWEEGNTSSPNSEVYSSSSRRRRPRRRREVLEREENDSVISSVSTHRSGNSTSATSKLGGKKYGSSSSKKPSQTPITAEALAAHDARVAGGRHVPASPANQPVGRDAPIERATWWGF
jgi:hypothetical protein